MGLLSLWFRMTVVFGCLKMLPYHMLLRWLLHAGAAVSQEERRAGIGIRMSDPSPILA